MEIDQPGSFICRFCKGSFTQAHHLHKHVQLIHTASPSTKNNRTCPICGTVFAKYEGYRTHLRHIHGQRNEGQIFAFKCFNDFFLWKTELESRSSCKYSLNSAPKLLPSNEKIHVYQCDGNSAAKKKKGSCSSVDNCAAMICATESLKNHEIKVEYWNTHVGHIVPVEDDELNAAIVVEEDELNAAINSVQSVEEPTMHVMDMLNSIDQSIETGAEVFVTETIEDDNSLSPIPKKNQKNIFNINKAKPSAVKTTNTPPIVQNFSFKKDPSKKKESSIYSLASVACGKISANKAVKSTEKNISKYQSSIRTNIPKSVASNSVCELNSIVNSISDLVENDTTDHLDHIPKSSLRDTIVGQLEPRNPSSSAKNKKQIVYNWPVGKPLPTDWVISDPPPSEEKSTKNSTEKENISSISNKIIVPLVSETNKSKQEKPAPKAVKPKTSKANNPTSKTKSTSKQASSASVAVTSNATQIAQSSKPLSTPHSAPQIINSIQNFAPTQLVPSALPAAQTYISVNNKLIPIVNTSFPPSLSSSVLLPILPKPPTGSILKTPTTASKVAAASYQPPAAGVVKQNTMAPLAGTVSTLSNSFSGSSVILLPCTNNSAIPSILHPGSSTPLVLQGITPVTTAPVNRSNMFMSSLLKTASVPLTQQTVSSVGVAKSTLAGPVSSLNPTSLSKGVKVQKVSLPTPNNSTSLLNKNINSVLTFSQPSQVSSVVLNTAPISSTPAINIPEASRSGLQKPGTYLFESSGELYMLEPLDDDLVVKAGSTPLTSTPKKVPNLSMHESFKKKLSPKKSGESVLRQKTDKTKKLETSQNISAAMGAAKRNILFPENSNSTSEGELKSPLSEFTRSVLKNQNKATIDSDFNNLINQKTEMTIKIAPSQNIGEKEVSIFAKTSTDVRTKLPVSGSSPLKYTPSLLTVKTVPSFSLHQSRPVTSTLNSFRNFTSSSLVTSSNYASSALQSTSSVNGSAPLLSSEKEGKESNSSEESLPQETQNVEVKRNVTIKSVVQEKRSATDDDIEVMKKVKFYKLEMKYLACQEQCKKLKIELAKALSKNKELLQDIDGKKENNELKQNDCNIGELNIEKENANCIESKELALNEKKVSHDIQQEKTTNDEIREVTEEISCDIKSVSSLDNADSERTDSVNEMEVEFEDSSCNGQSEKPMESDHQVPEESTNAAEDKCVEEDIDCDVQQEMDVDEVRKESTDSKEPCISEDSKDSQTKEKDHIEAKSNPNVDVFTMVRASVLKNLYLTIEDLTEEKKQLQKDLDEYQKLDLNMVPSFEECEDSL